MATHSSILAWETPWTEESGGLQSMELQRVGVTEQQTLSLLWSKVYQFSSVQLLSCVRLFATPWTTAHQAPLSMGFPRQESCSGLPFSSPGDLPDSGIETVSLVAPPLATGFDYCTTWEAPYVEIIN